MRKKKPEFSGDIRNNPLYSYINYVYSGFVLQAR